MISLRDPWWVGLLATALGAVFGFGSAYLTQRQQWRQEAFRREQEWKQQRQLRFEDQRRSLYATFARDYKRALDHLNGAYAAVDEGEPETGAINSLVRFARGKLREVWPEAFDEDDKAVQRFLKEVVVFDQVVDALRHSALEMTLVSIDESVPEAALDSLEPLIGLRRYLSAEEGAEMSTFPFDPHQYIADVEKEVGKRRDAVAAGLERFLEAARHELGEGTL